MKRMLIIGIVSLALGVILGLTVPSHPVEPEAVGLSEVVDPSEAVDRAEPTPARGGVPWVMESVARRRYRRGRWWRSFAPNRRCAV